MSSKTETFEHLIGRKVTVFEDGEPHYASIKKISVDKRGMHLGIKVHGLGEITRTIINHEELDLGQNQVLPVRVDLADGALSIFAPPHKSRLAI